MGRSCSARRYDQAIVFVRRSLYLLLVGLGAILLVSAARTPPADSPEGVCDVAPRQGAAAISAAIAACPDAGTVRFPADGSYTQADTIEVRDRSDLVIDGNGSTFTSSVPNDQRRRPSWRLLRAERVVLKDMTIVGNFKAEGPRGIQPQNQFNAGVSIEGGRTVTVRDVVVNDVWGDMVLTMPSGVAEGGNALTGEVPTDIHVERLKGRRAARMCVAFTAAKSAWLEDSVLEDCWYSGIDLEIDVPGQPLHDIHVLRNTLSGFFISAIAIPFYGNAGDIDDIEIRGNRTLTAQDACWPALQTKDTRNGRDGGQTATRIVVEDNHFKTITDGILIRDVLSGTLRNNRIDLLEARGPCAGTSRRPIVVEGSTIEIAGNKPTTGP